MFKPLKCILVLAALVSTLPVEANISNACSSLYKKLFLRDKATWSSEKVEILWFPASRHTKLRIGDQVIADHCPTDRCVITTMEKMDKSIGLGGGPRMHFAIRLEENELEALTEYINSGDFGRGLTCTHSVCRAVSDNTSLIIPIPASLAPALNAIYLSVAKFIPGSRVTKITLSTKKYDSKYKSLLKNLPFVLESSLFAFQELAITGVGTAAGIALFL